MTGQSVSTGRQIDAADGLQGVVMGPLATPFGRFEFDLLGRTAYAYTLVVLAAWLLVARRLVHSPFGVSLQALRDNRLRAANGCCHRGRGGSDESMTTVLETRGLLKRFCGITPTNEVPIKIERGARRALIGPNGAGKTTLIDLLTGVLEPTSGTIWLDGVDITHVAPHRRVRRGIVRTFQINQLFGELTPLQSLALSVSAQLASSARRWQPLGNDPRVAPICDALLRQFHLDDVMNLKVRHLAYSKRRLLEMATALAGRPRVLLLDEPVAGVPEGERQEIFDIVAALLIEHDMDLVFNFASSVTVLVNGAVFAEGDVQTISNDARVKAVYLGEGRSGDAHSTEAGPCG